MNTGRNACAPKQTYTCENKNNWTRLQDAHNLRNQFGPRSELTKCQTGSESKLFDTLMIFLKEFFETVDFEKNQQTTKSMNNYPVGKELNYLCWSSMTLKMILCRPLFNLKTLEKPR